MLQVESCPSYTLFHNGKKLEALVRGSEAYLLEECEDELEICEKCSVPFKRLDSWHMEQKLLETMVLEQDYDKPNCELMEKVLERLGYI
jgi:hypothetical protein